MKILTCVSFLCSFSVSAFAGSLPTYPTGFAASGITLESSTIKAVNDEGAWFCYSVHEIENNRLAGFNSQVKASLVREFKFVDHLCDTDGNFVGLKGPKDPSEKAMVDFFSLFLAQFELSQDLSTLDEKDILRDAIAMDGTNLNAIQPYISAQSGFDANSYPPVSDKAKHDWYNKASDWVNSVENFYLQ
jgi:hypothetical protein